MIRIKRIFPDYRCAGWWFWGLYTRKLQTMMLPTILHNGPILVFSWFHRFLINGYQSFGGSPWNIHNSWLGRFQVLRVWFSPPARWDVPALGICRRSVVDFQSEDDKGDMFTKYAKQTRASEMHKPNLSIQIRTWKIPLWSPIPSHCGG